MLRGIEGLVQVALVAALQNEALLDILCAGFPRLYQLRDIKLCLGIADQAFCIISRSQRHSHIVPYAAPVPRGGCRSSVSSKERFKSLNCRHDFSQRCR